MAKLGHRLLMRRNIVCYMLIVPFVPDSLSDFVAKVNLCLKSSVLVKVLPRFSEERPFVKI